MENYQKKIEDIACQILLGGYEWERSNIAKDARLIKSYNVTEKMALDVFLYIGSLHVRWHSTSNVTEAFKICFNRS